jgi:hypothetical protein
MFLVSLNISVIYWIDLCSENILFEIMYQNLQHWSYSKYAMSVLSNVLMSISHKITSLQVLLS